MINKLDYQNKFAYVDGEMIPYKLYLRNNKNVYIRVTPKLEIEVISNRYISEIALQNFINQHIKKFYEVIKHKSLNEQINKKFENMMIFGKKYNIKIIQINKPKSYEIIGSNIYLNIKVADDRLLLIKKILTELTIPYIKTRFAYWEKILHVQGTLNFQWMTTKWGVCNCGTKRIVLALQLGTNDKEAIDYVIVHELAHLYHPNHSVHFWDFVSLYIKNWQELRDKINLKK